MTGDLFPLAIQLRKRVASTPIQHMRYNLLQGISDNLRNNLFILRARVRGTGPPQL